MNFLCTDTSTDTMSIDINRGDEHFVFNAVGATKSSDLIISHCLQGLESLGLTWSDLTALVYNQGPGSFTGLRTSCAVLQGFSLVHRLPCFGFSSLLVLAQQALAHEPRGQRFLCVLDARMGEIYWAAFEWVNGDWITHIAPQVSAPQGISTPLAWQHEPNRDVCLVGHTQLSSLSTLQDKHPSLALNPQASGLNALAKLYVESGQKATWAQTGVAMPLYVRNQVAQTTAQRQQVQALN
jgi:tRNA threonylcarbamoyladenosine biosynthesis protein TsaB